MNKRLAFQRTLILFVTLAFQAPCNPQTYSTGDPVLTQHNDNGRTGAFLHEKRITVAALASQGMKLVVPPIDVGNDIETQVLYVPRLSMRTPWPRTTNVAIVTTTGNNVFAIDTDTGTVIWKAFLAKETNIQRPGGIHSTPVIDLETKTLYVVYRSNDFVTADGQSSFWLAKLDLLTGVVVNDTKIQWPDDINLDPHKPEFTFTASAQHNRPGLLLTAGGLYVAFGANYETKDPYHGWVFRYDPVNLTRLGVFCTSPDPDHVPPDSPTPTRNPGNAAGIWQSGGGLASDSAGNVYFATGNGPPPYGGIDPPCPNLGAKSNPNDKNPNDKGNAVLKLDLSLNVSAQYEIPQGFCFSDSDLDLGSGGVLLIPNLNRVVAGGKPGLLYLLQTQPAPNPLSTTPMLPQINKFQAFYNIYVAKSAENTNTEPPYNFDLGSNPHLHGTPVYWQGPDPSFAYVYAWSEKDYLKAFKFHLPDGNFGQFGTDDARCPPQRGEFLCNGLAGNQYVPLTNNPQMPGGMLSLSANGNVAGTGVLWAVLRTVPNYYANTYRDVLLAYDAQTLKLIWQDAIPAIPKWAVPTIADGKVLVGSASGMHSLSIYELRLGPPAAVRASASSDTSPVNVTWAIEDPGTDSVDVEVEGAPGSGTLANSVRSYVFPSLANGLKSSIRVCSHKGAEENCSPWVQPLNTTVSIWLDITKAELDQTGWGFSDVNTVEWARASRAAFGFCTFNGFVGGQLNGYQAVDDDGVLTRAGVVCHGSGAKFLTVIPDRAVTIAKFFDSTSAERASSAWNFANVDTVQWSVASRLASDYCQARHYIGGQFDGNQATNATGVLMGIVCYGGEFNDAAKVAKEFGFQDVNTVPWAQAARAGYDWCRQHSDPPPTPTSAPTYYPLGGRLNGYESANSFGTVCYK